MHYVWINGWGLNIEETLSFACSFFPNDKHSIYNPCEKTLEMLPELEWDHLFAYSLGAMLASQTEISNATYIAPFIVFNKLSSSEFERTYKRTTLTLQALEDNPLSTVNSYRKTIGLGALSSVPYPVEDLTWGLNFILSSKTEGQCSIPSIIGANDDVIPYKKQSMSQYFSQLTVIEGCDHNFKILFRHAISK